jgi:hypothetical protein
MSTTLSCSPQPANSRAATRWVPPYTSADSTRWSPGASVCSTVEVAAMPEAKQSAPPGPAGGTPSSDARQASSPVRVGLAVRAYS